MQWFRISVDFWPRMMNARQCEEIVRSLREAARGATDLQLGDQLNELADLWEEVQRNIEEVETGCTTQNARPRK